VLAKAEARFKIELRDDERARCHCFTPEEFLAFLDAVAPRERTTTVGDYRVKVNYRDDEASAKKGRAAAEVVLRSLRQLRKKT
jgi:hypothetical protein